MKSAFDTHPLADTLQRLGYADISHQGFRVKARIGDVHVQILTLPGLSQVNHDGSESPMHPPAFQPSIGTPGPNAPVLERKQLLRDLRLLAAAARSPARAPTLAGIPWLAPAMELLLVTGPGPFRDPLKALGYTILSSDSFRTEATIGSAAVKILTVPTLSRQLPNGAVIPFHPTEYCPICSRYFNDIRSHIPLKGLPYDTVMDHLGMLAKAMDDIRLAPTLAAIPWLAPAMELLLG